MSNAYLKNAFRMLDALNEDIFDVSDEGISQLADTLNTEDNTVNIIDPEAESEEDLQDSYMDKVILECEVCHSLIYKNKDEINIDDESQLANIDEECPYCFSTNGYKIVGQVAPFKEESDEEDIEVEVDGDKVEVDSEDNEDEDFEESLKEGFNDVQITTDDQHLTMTQDNETGKVTVETEPIQQEESFESEDMMIAPLNDEDEQEIEDNSDQLNNEEDEDSNDEISFDNSEEVEDTEAGSENEESEDEESEEVDVADFEESLFNDLGQKYLTEVYDNIESFNTSNVYQDNKNNKLIIEGVIKFNSGNSKKTSFIFEAKDIDKDRKVRFVGENQQITKGKKSFTLRGTLKDGTLLSESLTYNYRTRDNDGESIRLYNTIKVDK